MDELDYTKQGRFTRLLVSGKSCSVLGERNLLLLIWGIRQQVNTWYLHILGLERAALWQVVALEKVGVGKWCNFSKEQEYLPMAEKGQWQTIDLLPRPPP